MAWGSELGPELELGLGWNGKSSNSSPSQVPLRRTLTGPTPPGHENRTARNPWKRSQDLDPDEFPAHSGPEQGSELEPELPQHPKHLAS